MRPLRRLIVPVLLVGALLFFLGAPYLDEAPPASDGFAASPVMHGFDGARYDANGVRYRLRAARVRGASTGRQILQQPRFSSREADGGQWELRAARGELQGETLRLYERVHADHRTPGGVPLEVRGERMEWTRGAPLQLEGAPALFHHRLSQPVRGGARHLYFDPRDNRLRLEGEAVLERPDGVLRSESLEYFVRAE